MAYFAIRILRCPQLELRIQRMNAYLFQGLQAWQPKLNLLQTIPGMDVQVVAMLLVEIGADMGAFGSTERLASWVGMCPGNNESAGKRKSGRIRKGNAWVRIGCCASSPRPQHARAAPSKPEFDALSIRKGHKKSIAALAHKMLRIIYAMLESGAHYQVRSVDYEALSVAKNVPRWIKMLRKYGHMPASAASPRQVANRPASGQAFSRFCWCVFKI